MNAENADFSFISENQRFSESKNVLYGREFNFRNKEKIHEPGFQPQNLVRASDPDPG